MMPKAARSRCVQQHAMRCCPTWKIPGQLRPSGSTERQLLLCCANFFHLYGISREHVDYIMHTFPVVPRNDERKYSD